MLAKMRGPWRPGQRAGPPAGDVQGEGDFLQSSKTTVEFKSTGTNGVLSRTTAAGNDNSMHTPFLLR